MRYIWFWTFWHWSKESFRSGAILRDPLQGIAGHWDEWFRHEASESDHRSIENVGRAESAQREFVFWLCRHWTPEASPNQIRQVSRFVLGQLAHVPPFNGWRALARYRAGHGLDGIQAIVLADRSPGEPGDVRTVEALILPRHADVTAAPLVTEGFQAEASDLRPVLQAATSLLSGKGLINFLARWLVSGRRPYPPWLAVALFLGWLNLAGLILLLAFGPDPGGALFLAEAVLVGLWAGLVAFELSLAGVLAGRAWRTGVVLRMHLDNSQARLGMGGGLTLKGGSAGLPFCLNVLSSLYRAYPRDSRPSWLWQRFFRSLCSEGGSWAATGVLTPEGHIEKVVLAPKLLACLRCGRVRAILTPAQPEASEATVDSMTEAAAEPAKQSETAEMAVPGVQFGFAAEAPQLRLYRCTHIAKAVMVIGGLISRRQLAANIFSVIVSGVMLAALPDLRSVLLPHPAPAAIPPASPSPYDLWVSLDTKFPRYFGVVLESDYWSNRRAEVKAHAELVPSIRAVIPFHRLTGVTAAHEDDGVVWIERRHRFLAREFLPGERVGRYSIPYLSRLGHEQPAP